jgi:hypothetical protein
VKEAVQPTNRPSKAKVSGAPVPVDAKPTVKDVAKPANTPGATKVSGAPVETPAGGALKVDKRLSASPAATTTKPVTAKVVTTKITVADPAVNKQEAPKPAPAKAVVIQPDENPPAQAGLFGDEVILPKTTKAGKLQAVVSVKKK